MEEVAGSIPASSTPRRLELLGPDPWVGLGMLLGGLVAGEGTFTTARVPPSVSGADRKRFVFAVELVQGDRPLLDALQDFLGFGSVADRPARKAAWQPTSQLMVHSQRAHAAATIPFAVRFLPPSTKRLQFEAWRRSLSDYRRDHPARWGEGPSTCRVPGCGGAVRGRGLCRHHYYVETGH